MAIAKTITKKELSELLDLSLKRINDLVTQGILKKNKAGSYDITNITDYVIHERTKLPDLVKLSDLADFLDLSERRIQQLAEEEVIERVRKGQYNFTTSVKNYMESLKTVYGDIEDEDGTVHRVDLKEVKTKKQIEYLEAQIADKKTRNRKTEGELYEAKDVEKVWANATEIFKSRLLNIAPRLAPKLKGEEDVKYIEQVIDEDITEALESLANINIEEYKSKETLEMEVEEFELTE